MNETNYLLEHIVKVLRKKKITYLNSACCLSDNHLQMDVQVCLHGKKKSPGKRITGFQVVKFSAFTYDSSSHCF